MIGPNNKGGSKQSFFARMESLLANCIGVVGAFFGGPLLHAFAGPFVGDYASDRYADWLEGPVLAAFFLFSLVISFAVARFAWSVGMKELIVWWRLRKI